MREYSIIYVSTDTYRMNIGKGRIGRKMRKNRRIGRRV